jgi:FAD/FMN-containing dehydrogenase
VLADGTVWTSRPLGDEELREAQRRPDRVGAVHRAVDAIQREHAAEIEARFPRLNRCLTGYDLAHIRDREGRFDLNAVLCGAEGTLAVLAEAKLNVLPIPKRSALVNLRYGSFDAALRDAQALMAFGPASIETVDSKVLALAQEDIVWDGVREFFPDDASGPGPAHQHCRVRRWNTEEEVEKRRWRRLTRGGRRLEARAAAPASTIAFPGRSPGGPDLGDAQEAVGCSATCRATSGPSVVEDTAVPPENLADYIAEFRAPSTAAGSPTACSATSTPACSMSAGDRPQGPGAGAPDPGGHRGGGRAHRKHGGLLWGEHGKGVRSEFSAGVLRARSTHWCRR